MSIDAKTVRHVAHLARLTLDEKGAEAMTKELNAVLAWGEQLDAVNTDGVEPMISPVHQPLPMREDKVTDGHKQADILLNAPVTEEGFFLVPKVVE